MIFSICSPLTIGIVFSLLRRADFDKRMTISSATVSRLGWRSALDQRFQGPHGGRVLLTAGRGLLL